MKLNETPLSYKLRLTIFCLFTTQNIGNSMIPVFIGYMVYNFSKDLARETDRESYTAFYVGIIEANNKLMSFVGSFIWGYVSDKISKKNTLIWVLVGNIISFTLLGIADKYWVAFAARTLAGLCAGIVPVTKALIKSTTDDSNYARLFSYCGNKYKGMGTGFGSLLGPLAAGFLSYPNPNFPVIFDNSRLNAYPFLFPNLF
jgi:MFS family permease